MTWDWLWDAGRTISAALVGLGVPGLLVYFVQDRKKSQAAGLIAERTIDAAVVVQDVGAQEARLVYAVKAFDAERESLHRQLADRDTEIDRQRTELTHRDEQLAHRDQVIAELRAEIEALQERLTAVRDRLSELTDSEET